MLGSHGALWILARKHMCGSKGLQRGDAEHSAGRRAGFLLQAGHREPQPDSFWAVPHKAVCPILRRAGQTAPEARPNHAALRHRLPDLRSAITGNAREAAASCARSQAPQPWLLSQLRRTRQRRRQRQFPDFERRRGVYSQRPQPNDRTRCLHHFSEPKAFLYTVFNYISNIFEVWVTTRASFGFGNTKTMLGIAQLGSNAMKATPVVRVATTRGVNAMINNVKVNGGTLTHARLIADALNEYFVNVGPKLADQIPESEVNPIDFLDQPGPSVFRFRSIDVMKSRNWFQGKSRRTNA